ncbi:YoaK family protein [Actinomadura sp. DC4]|uniref:YoaK family protein n=1 Tax=Actinomadura sp. DC4 TaxID=3055069 RepID=UPI0025B2044F|nr:YoaK family protein [Actinomadura sp. DC4]MDN3355906.1 YoaK family protein [Actinomadura sp. DC4]
MTERPVTHASVQLGVLLAVAGGFLDAFSYLELGGVFANAQTGNVVLFGVEAARAHGTDAVRHIPSILAFVVGVVVAETLLRPRVAAALRWPSRFALVLEIAVLAVVGLLPRGVPDSVLIVMIAFTASVQVTMFRTLIDWPYNTAMVTGNLRSAAQAAYLAVADRDPEAVRKARSFAIVIGAFVVGAFGGGWLTLHVGRHAIWISAGVLVAALGLFVVDERFRPEE